MFFENLWGQLSNNELHINIKLQKENNNVIINKKDEGELYGFRFCFKI